MLKQEADRRERQHALAHPHADRVMSFQTWCAVNGFSPATGRRIRKAGLGPKFIRLSERRVGVRESDNREWQEKNSTT
jgi:hypothetical protein